MLLFLIVFDLNVLFAKDISDFSNKALLVKEFTQGKLESTYLGYLDFNKESNQYRASKMSISSASFLGVCINQDLSPCTLKITYKDLMAPAFQMASGKVIPTTIPNLPDVEVSINTKILTTDFEKNMVKLTTEAFGKSVEFQIFAMNPMSSQHLNFPIIEKDLSNRLDVTEVTAELKELATSVVQIKKSSDKNNLLHDQAGAGTGFFLSKDGIVLTNHHVISMYPDCIAKQFCKIDLEQVLPDNSRIAITGINAYVLAYSIQNDFALLKIKVPESIKFNPLKLYFGSIENDLFTFGFPGDRKLPNDGGTKLTYSFGCPVGLYGLGVMSSVYISGGASGSPILNMKNREVIGLLSNGAGSSLNGMGDPGIFRPIGLLEAQFSISQYLDGQKQSRIKALLNSLNSTNDEGAANSILESIQNEKSFYGTPYLRELMVGHSSKAIRKLILIALQKMEVVSGNPL